MISNNRTGRFYSVEFSAEEFSFHYQFKLRSLDSMDLFVLTKENSNFLRRIKVGDTFTVKYNPVDSFSSAEYLETVISNIIKNEKGPYKSHYLVYLEITGKSL